MADVLLKSVSKRLGANQVIDALSLDVTNGEFVTLLGPSGCGKTTLLRSRIAVEATHELLNTTNFYWWLGGSTLSANYEHFVDSTSSGSGGIQFASFLLGTPDGVTSMPSCITIAPETAARPMCRTIGKAEI